MGKKSIGPELLAPAGNMEKLHVALLYGADAVYFAGKEYGLRAFSDNFDRKEIREGIQLAHSFAKKAYITINIFAHNDDLELLPEYVHYLAECKADGVIVSDPGIYSIVKEVEPDLPIHISTQANTTNWAAVQFWKRQGAKRIVLARELSLAEIMGIRDRVDVELECFVHGAMCVSYSGRCLLSNYFTGRDANRGACTQPCRWKYSLVEETRPGQYWSVEEDKRGTYIFNSKDLCLLEQLPGLLNAGVNSLKIEGRMKSIHYVATVVKVYREAIDDYIGNPSGFLVRKEWRDELEKISHRAYSGGFLHEKPSEADHIYHTKAYSQTHDFVGLVISSTNADGWTQVEQRNNLKLGDEIEILTPEGVPAIQCIKEMKNEEWEDIIVAPHPQQKIFIRLDHSIPSFAMLRRRIVENG